MAIDQNGSYNAQDGVSYELVVYHPNGTSIFITFGTWLTEADAEQVVQDLMDYLDVWDKRDMSRDVTGFRTRRYQYQITPTPVEPTP